MWLFETIPSAAAVKTLVWCGGAAIAWSSVLGFMMLLPMQPWAPKVPRTINFKQVGAAHLDWIVLGLMLGLAAAVIQVYSITPSIFVVVSLSVGAWMNPLPYVFRAFGINAFVLGGSAVQRAAASLGLLSSLGILYGWFMLLYIAAAS